MDLPDDITTWQQFRSEYAKLNPKSNVSRVSEAWSRYKEEGRVGDVSTKRSARSSKRTPKKASPKKPSTTRTKKPSIKRTQKKISPKKSPKHAKKTSPKVVREPSTELIPVSASLTGLPVELGTKISGYAGKGSVRSLQIASKRTAEFSLVELKKLCETEPTAKEYGDAITSRNASVSFYTRDQTAFLSRIGEVPEYSDIVYSFVRQGMQINLRRTVIFANDYVFRYTSEVILMKRRQDLRIDLTVGIIPYLIDDLEAKQAEIHHKTVSRTHPTVYDLDTVREVYKRRLSCVETADNYITERLRAYIVRSYESIIDSEIKIDGKVVLSGDYKSIQVALLPLSYYKTIRYQIRLITLITTLEGVNIDSIVSITANMNKPSSTNVHKYLLDKLRNIYDSV